jgi:hypothetical protein
MALSIGQKDLKAETGNRNCRGYGQAEPLLFFKPAGLIVSIFLFLCSFQVKPGQVKLLITNNEFLNYSKSKSKNRNFRDYGIAEAPPGFQAAAGLIACTFSHSLFIFFHPNRK